jgi:hypothetical protein
MMYKEQYAKGGLPLPVSMRADPPPWYDDRYGDRYDDRAAAPPGPRAFPGDPALYEHGYDAPYGKGPPLYFGRGPEAPYREAPMYGKGEAGPSVGRLEKGKGRAYMSRIQ